MAGLLWWNLRKTAALISLEYGHTLARLYATDLQMQEGPPVAIAFDLEHNLRTRHRGTRTYIDTKALADGRIRRLTVVRLSDKQALARLDRHLERLEDTTAPWTLIVTLGGRHAFTVTPEYREPALILRVVAGAA